MSGDSKIDVNDLHVFVAGRLVCLRQIIVSGGSSATFEVRLSPKDALLIAVKIRDEAVRLGRDQADEAARAKRPVF